MGNVCCINGGGGGGDSSSKRAAPTSPATGSCCRATQDVEDQLRETAHTLLEQQPQPMDYREEPCDGSLGHCRRALPPTKLFKGTASSNDNHPAAVTSSSHIAKRYSYNMDKIALLFEKYKEPDSDIMDANGISQFCKDLDISAEDFRILVFAWKCKAEVMCQFTKSEFIEGLSSLCVDSIPSLVPALNRVVSEFQPLNDDEHFASLYKWVFSFAPSEDTAAICNAQQAQQAQNKNQLSLDMAKQLWSIVFQQPHMPALVYKWLEFLELHSDQIDLISRDTWNLFLILLRRFAYDLSTYDESEAWPSIFDDFVHFHNDQTNQNCAKNNSPWDEQGNGNLISSP